MLRRVLRVSVASGVLLLTGCAGSVPLQWAGNNGNFPRDNYECARDSRTFGGGSGIEGIMAMNEAERQATKLYRMCMESKGYKAVCPPGTYWNDDHDKCKSGDKTPPPHRVEPWCTADCLAKLLVGDWEVVGEPQRRLHLSQD
jgi:hypothetical protein